MTYTPYSNCVYPTGVWIDQGTSTQSITFQTWATAASQTATIGNCYQYGLESQTYGYPAANTYGYTTVCNTFYYPIQIEETEEQRAEREQRQRDEAAKDAARRKRARELLVDVLNPEQREQFEKDGHFELLVNGRLYRVRPERRVELLDLKSKRTLSYYCVHPDLTHYLPAEDVALAQMLLLQSDEATFLATANMTLAQQDGVTPEEALAA